MDGIESCPRSFRWQGKSKGDDIGKVGRLKSTISVEKGN